MSRPNFLQRMKTKYNVQTTVGLVKIMTVFSLAGMAIMWVRKPVFHALGITAQTPFILKSLAWLAVVFPTYQINLLVFGFLFGQFPFFWEREKKFLRFLRRVIFERRQGMARQNT
ncbi:MAG: hypothetical protein HZA29_03290 [Candidatus Omnitrophica bacterium]|nr:hypothetical protein [Candidatus Omnitrophota bacterium]